MLGLDTFCACCFVLGSIFVKVFV